jgi:hypothetical protein
MDLVHDLRILRHDLRILRHTSHYYLPGSYFGSFSVYKNLVKLKKISRIGPHIFCLRLVSVPSDVVDGD